MKDLVFSKLVKIASEHSSEDTIIVMSAMADFIEESVMVNRSKSLVLAAKIAKMVTTEEGLEEINDLWYKSVLNGENDQNSEHSAYYYRIAAKNICYRIFDMTN